MPANWTSAISSRYVFVSMIAGTARCKSGSKNSRQTVRVCSGMRCKTNSAEVIMPSQPSFWTPGRPPKNLLVTSLPNPCLRNDGPGIISASGSPIIDCPSGS